MRAAAAAAGRTSACPGHRPLLKRVCDLVDIMTCPPTRLRLVDAPGPTSLTHINALWFQTAKTSSGLSGSRLNADPLGKGHKLRQGFDLHLLHHFVAMGLHGTCRYSLAPERSACWDRRE